MMKYIICDITHGTNKIKDMTGTSIAFTANAEAAMMMAASESGMTGAVMASTQASAVQVAETSCSCAPRSTFRFVSSFSLVSCVPSSHDNALIGFLTSSPIIVRSFALRVQDFLKSQHQHVASLSYSVCSCEHVGVQVRMRLGGCMQQLCRTNLCLDLSMCVGTREGNSIVRSCANADVSET